MGLQHILLVGKSADWASSSAVIHIDQFAETNFKHCEILLQIVIYIYLSIAFHVQYQMKAKVFNDITLD